MKVSTYNFRVKTYTTINFLQMQSLLNNNDVIEASNDHRFILLNKEIKTTEQLRINDYLTNDLYVKTICCN